MPNAIKRITVQPDLLAVNIYHESRHWSWRMAVWDIHQILYVAISSLTSLLKLESDDTRDNERDSVCVCVW